jgi:hypothetical protein
MMTKKVLSRLDMGVSRGGKGAIGGSNWTYFGALPTLFTSRDLCCPVLQAPTLSTLQGEATSKANGKRVEDASLF